MNNQEIKKLIKTKEIQNLEGFHHLNFLVKVTDKIYKVEGVYFNNILNVKISDEVKDVSFLHLNKEQLIEFKKDKIIILKIMKLVEAVPIKKEVAFVD